MNPSNRIVVKPLFNAEVIALSASATSYTVNLSELGVTGSFSIKLKVTGSGTVKAEYLLSDDENNTFLEPSGASDIVSGFTSASGTGGEDIISFSSELAPFMQIKVTEIGGANSATVTLSLMVQ